MTLFHTGDCGLFAILCPTKYISKSRSKTFQDIHQGFTGFTFSVTA